MTSVTEEFLRLDLNEALPSGETLALAPEWIARYADPSELVEAYAMFAKAPPECVLATAGADDALDRLARLASGQRVVVARPTFGTLVERLRANGAELVEVPWQEGAFPVEAFARASRDAAFLFVVSPNNPTGLACSAAELATLRTLAPRPLLVVDAAYEEFAAEPLTAAALKLPRTIVLRTLSKAWGLAGLRIGCALGAPEMLAPLRRLALPFAIATPSIALACAALATGEGAMRARVERVRSERDRIAGSLRAIGFAVPPSEGNFVYARGAGAIELAGLLAERRIRVRSFPDDEAIRITAVGDREVERRLLVAIDAAFALAVKGGSR
jgi:histidinol-phosphate aminotransferase